MVSGWNWVQEDTYIKHKQRHPKTERGRDVKVKLIMKNVAEIRDKEGQSKDNVPKKKLNK